MRIEFEADYRQAGPDWHEVETVGRDTGVYGSCIPLNAKITVLPKPLRVGDKVRLGVDPEPPDGTVLLRDDGRPYRREFDQWTVVSSHTRSYVWDDLSGDGEATVVWLPGGV